MTLPSHANILSGRLPFQHGVRDNAGFRFPADTATLATMLKAAGYRTGAFVSAFTLDSRFGLERGFDVYDDRLDGPTGPLALPERRAADTVAAAKRWLAEGDGRPTFCWIHLYDPHAPYAPRGAVRVAPRRRTVRRRGRGDGRRPRARAAASARRGQAADARRDHRRSRREPRRARRADARPLRLRSHAPGAADRLRSRGGAAGGGGHRRGP